MGEREAGIPWAQCDPELRWMAEYDKEEPMQDLAGKLDRALFGQEGAYMGEDEPVVVDAKDAREASNGEGVVLIGAEDDPIVAIFERGNLVAVAYASYRGVYQAGAFDGTTRYAKTDSQGLAEMRGVPFNAWYETGDQDICADIAAETFRRIEGSEE
jgi:hypothetical protein